jgi:dihydrofolate synthase/folylpolyglutamate synthase
MTLPREVAVSEYASPREALLAALEAAGSADRIAVFGSFYTVGGVLEGGLPRRAAKHLH